MRGQRFRVLALGTAFVIAPFALTSAAERGTAYDVVADNRFGGPVLLDDVSAHVKGEQSAAVVEFDVTVLNVSGKPVAALELKWDGHAAEHRPVHTGTSTVRRKRPMPPGGQWTRRLTHAPLEKSVDHFTLAVSSVMFGDGSEWRLDSAPIGRLRAAAEQNNANACYQLGLAYQEGWDVVQDDTLAWIWLQLAAANGHPEAAVARDSLARRMTPDEVKEAGLLARKWAVEFYNRSIEIRRK